MTQISYTDLPIDMEHLHQLSEGDKSFEMEILQVFLEDAQSHITAAKQAIAANDSHQLKREAHHLKGSSGNVGASAMQVLAHDLEQQAIQEDFHVAAPIVTELQNRLTQVKAFIDSGELEVS